MTREEATRRNTTQNELKPNRSGIVTKRRNEKNG